MWPVRLCFHLCIGTLRSMHNESFIAVERGPICISSVTSEMSMRECGSLGKLPVLGLKSVKKWSRL